MYTPCPKHNKPLISAVISCEYCMPIEQRHSKVIHFPTFKPMFGLFRDVTTYPARLQLGVSVTLTFKCNGKLLVRRSVTGGCKLADPDKRQPDLIHLSSSFWIHVRVCVHSVKNFFLTGSSKPSIVLFVFSKLAVVTPYNSSIEDGGQWTFMRTIL